MSSDPPSDAPSPAADAGDPGAPSGAALIRARGEPLLDALEARLAGSRAHADATATWALAIAVELGVGRDRSLEIREAARLHDIGKVYAEAMLLNRPERELSAAEARALDEHAGVGSRLAEGAGVPVEPVGWLRHARERYDGRGPEGLYGGAIPLESRILRTACAFQLSMERASASAEWRSAPTVLALAELRTAAGRELDRGAVEALAAVIART